MERVERAIFIVRGRRVILDSDLAALCDVTVSRFNEAAKRNARRFPTDFAFQLTVSIRQSAPPVSAHVGTQTGQAPPDGKARDREW
jgi:hypothetical protein